MGKESGAELTEQEKRLEQAAVTAFNRFAQRQDGLHGAQIHGHEVAIAPNIKTSPLIAWQSLDVSKSIQAVGLADDRHIVLIGEAHTHTQTDTEHGETLLDYRVYRTGEKQVEYNPQEVGAASVKLFQELNPLTRSDLLEIHSVKVPTAERILQDLKSES